MLRARLVEPESIRLENVPVPEPQKGEVLIEVHRAGVCGSDVHAYYGKHPFINCPVVPGHEFSGVIVDTGDAVQKLRTGQKVVVEPSLVCGKCLNCRSGRYNICSDLQVIGCQTDGAMSEYIAVPQDRVVPIPADMTLDDAVLVEPLAVAVHAVRRAVTVAGKRAVVLGSGPIGLFTAACLRAYNAREVVVTDLLDWRLKLAEEHGATKTFNSSTGTQLAAWLDDILGREAVDVIFECVGVESTMVEAIKIARKGTPIIVAGVFAADIRVPMALVQDKELEITGTLMYTHADFEEAIRLIYDRHVRTKGLITHHFPLFEAADAFAAIADEEQHAFKVVIDCCQSSH